jgi:hypothetical protein
MIAEHQQLTLFPFLFQEGDRVKALRHLDNPAGDCHPASRYASKGEELVVRRINRDSSLDWYIAVSHPEVVDSSFMAGDDELIFV